MFARFNLPFWRRWRTTAVFLAVALIGVIVWDGADRDPADATQPLVIDPVPSADPLPEDAVLRIASFNIHSGKGDEGVVDLTRTARLLENCDLAGLYEVRGPQFSGSPDQASELGDQLDIGASFIATERRWWRDHFGNAILTSRPLGSVQRIPLPGTRGKAFRNAVLVELPWGTETVNVLATHIDREEDRDRQLQQVLSLFQALEPPAILMGDLNTTADDPQLTVLLESPDVESPLHQVLAEKLPADNIDWVFTRGLTTVSAELVENDASDHPILRAELRLESGPAAAE